MARNVLRIFAVAAFLILTHPHRMFGAAESKAYLKARDADVQAWRELKFGLFVHWGPVSLQGTEIGWSRAGERRGTGGTGTVPVEVYDNLYRQFDPTEFDAERWVRVAQDAGMCYLVFTTKHHDGFSMFDSQLTDYKVTNSPFGRDVVKELADACHRAGLKLGFYYSPPDWHHPDYRTANHARYIAYLHGQVRELCTNYGTVGILCSTGWAARPVTGTQRTSSGWSGACSRTSSSTIAPACPPITTRRNSASAPSSATARGRPA
jgi:hypothetical protein